MNNETFQADIGKFESEDKYKKIVDELKEWLKTKINHCEVLFDDEEYSWNEDFIASLIDRRTTFHMVEDKIKELEEKHE